MKRGPLSDSYGGNLDLRATADLSKGLFGRDLPGVYARNVEGLGLDGLHIEWSDDVPDYFRHGSRSRGSATLRSGASSDGSQAESGAAIVLCDGEGATIGASRLTEGADAFLVHERVGGLRVLADNDTSKARQMDN